MKYHELFEMYFERSNALEALWTIYIAGIAALAALLSATREKRYSPILLSVGFAIFAYANLTGLKDVTAQRVALKACICESTDAGMSPPEKADFNVVRAHLVPALGTFSFSGVLALHLFCDVLAVSAIWIVLRFA